MIGAISRDRKAKFATSGRSGRWPRVQPVEGMDQHRPVVGQPARVVGHDQRGPLAPARSPCRPGAPGSTSSTGTPAADRRARRTAGRTRRRAAARDRRTGARTASNTAPSAARILGVSGSESYVRSSRCQAVPTPVISSRTRSRQPASTAGRSAGMRPAALTEIGPSAPLAANRSRPSAPTILPACRDPWRRRRRSPRTPPRPCLPRRRPARSPPVSACRAGGPPSRAGSWDRPPRRR